MSYVRQRVAVAVAALECAAHTYVHIAGSFARAEVIAAALLLLVLLPRCLSVCLLRLTALRCVRSLRERFPTKLFGAFARAA